MCRAKDQLTRKDKKEKKKKSKKVSLRLWCCLFDRLDFGFGDTKGPNEPRTRRTLQPEKVREKGAAIRGRACVSSLCRTKEGLLCDCGKRELDQLMLSSLT